MSWVSPAEAASALRIFFASPATFAGLKQPARLIASSDSSSST